VGGEVSEVARRPEPPNYSVCHPRKDTTTQQFMSFRTKMRNLRDTPAKQKNEMPAFASMTMKNVCYFSFEPESCD